MARVDAGALSLGASGTIGGAITFSRWKGRPYVRQRVIPSNPKTPLQIGMRSWMRYGSQVWATLSAANQATWDGLADADAISPFNAFIRHGQRRARNNQGYTRQYPAEVDVTPDAPGAPAATAGTRQISVTWTDPVTPATVDVFGAIVYRSTTIGFTAAPGNIIQVVQAGVEQYVDSPLNPGTYYYRIRAFNIEGELGTLAAEVNATV